MSVPSAFQVMLPTLAPIAAGYVVGRWVGLPTGAVEPLLRYVFFPALVFNALYGRLAFQLFLILAAVGATMTFAGLFLARQSQRVLKPNVDDSAGALNIACFSLPLLALSWATKGLATACALFVGMAVALAVTESRRDAKSLLTEPWLYAVVLALILQTVRAPLGWIPKMLTPVALGAYPVLLLYLGAALHPVALASADAWVTVAIRLLSGVGVGLLAVKVLPLSSAVSEGLILAALAPPATRALALRDTTGDTPTAQAAAALGTLISFALIGALLFTGWKPWNL